MNRPTVVQVVIDGKHFECIRAAHGAAQGMGFAGGVTALAGRLRNGASTWAEILAPLNVTATRNAKHMSELNATRRETERLEMLALCAELDMRKAALRCAE